MVELLKQPQYQPYSFTDEVLSIFTGTQGFLDDLPANQVAKFEQALLKHFRDEHPEICQELADKGELPDALADRIRGVIKSFKPHWQGQGQASQAA